MLDSNTKTLFLLHSIWIKKNTQSPSDGHLMWRTDSFEKTLMLGNTKAWGEGNDRGWDSWMASATQWTWVWVNSGSWFWTGKPSVLQSIGVTKSWTGKKSRAPENWCFWTVVLEKTLESPLDNKEIKSVNPKGNQPWILFGRTDAEAEASILWPPDTNSWLIGKHPDAGKDWKQEKG